LICHSHALPAPLSAQAGGLSEAGKKELYDIGRMMAFDILIFNYDRLPCVFQNGGNTENIMISEAHPSSGARPPATHRRLTCSCSRFRAPWRRRRRGRWSPSTR
jgi:hypothetical protein